MARYLPLWLLCLLITGSTIAAPWPTTAVQRSRGLSNRHRDIAQALPLRSAFAGVVNAVALALIVVSAQEGYSERQTMRHYRRRTRRAICCFWLVAGLQSRHPRSHQQETVGVRATRRGRRVGASGAFGGQPRRPRTRWTASSRRHIILRHSSRTCTGSSSCRRSSSGIPTMSSTGRRKRRCSRRTAGHQRRHLADDRA